MNKPTWHDPLTGLEWQINPPGKMSWYDAENYSATLDLAGHRDWYFPGIVEMESLLDRTKYRPEMREDVPFRDELTYWSSTTFGINTQNAWVIMYDGAYVLSYYKTNTYHVRCVRGKMGVTD